jgi:ribosomal protein S6
MEKELTQISALPQVYEVGFHLIPTVAEEDLGALVTGVRDSIETAGGRMISDEYPKLMELAYPMVKVVANNAPPTNPPTSDG